MVHPRHRRRGPPHRGFRRHAPGWEAPEGRWGRGWEAQRAACDGVGLVGGQFGAVRAPDAAVPDGVQADARTLPARTAASCGPLLSPQG